MHLINRTWFRVVCNFAGNDIRHHIGQKLNVVRLVSPQQILTTVQMNIIFDKSTDNAEPHSISFLPQYSTPNKMFISERGQDHNKEKVSFV